MRTAFALVLVACAVSTIAAEGDDPRLQRADRVLRESFDAAMPDEWRSRLTQDDAQRYCSRSHDAPAPAIRDKITGEARASMRYPRSGELFGSWREGERLASSVSGGHLSTIQPEPVELKRGGNCYACHALSPREVAAGDVGPSLTGYGKLHGRSSTVVKAVYEKIYNSYATLPCSPMPRFGHNSWLSPEQITDIVAFLLDPESPVNQ